MPLHGICHAFGKDANKTRTMNKKINYDRYFLSYSGVKLPLKLVGELEPAEIENRNTFFATCEDEQGRPLLIHKLVYGDIDLEHRYGYRDSGIIEWAEIINLDEDMQRFEFNESGQSLR